jgi:hypothetical protein
MRIAMFQQENLVVHPSKGDFTEKYVKKLDVA